LFDQIAAFRGNHLPIIGAKNVFFANGYEADDLIASCIHNMPNARKVYIVSNDEDMYQLIQGNRVVVYKPSKKVVVNENDFRSQHNEMPPCLYASAKAWAGCSSDNIIGMERIGMGKAAQFVMGKGKPEFRKRFFDNVELFNRNIQLTRLPAPGTPQCVPVPQDTPLQWHIMAEAFKSARRPKGIKQ
jgi:5'-3' exonuclease